MEASGSGAFVSPDSVRSEEAEIDELVSEVLPLKQLLSSHDEWTCCVELGKGRLTLKSRLWVHC